MFSLLVVGFVGGIAAHTAVTALIRAVAHLVRAPETFSPPAWMRTGPDRWGADR